VNVAARTPVVGITNCSRTDDYVESVRRAGGEPVILDWTTTSAADALQRADAVLLTGGPDVDPSRYAEQPHGTTRPAEPERDRFELELAARALERDVPMLAICRGMQVLNVAAGGTLIQDIPSELAKAVRHDIREPKNAVAHTVALAPDSRLARLLGTREAAVNSRHHQAVREAGQGLIITAVAPDGIVEAIERPAATFCVGVEWHPENFVASGEFLALFRGLVEAAEVRNIHHRDSEGAEGAQRDS
jgi:putative glutamine amidotransferase